MRRVLLAACLFTLLLTTAIFLMVELGHTLPLPALLTDLDACHLPCWSGIRPGETQLGVADDALIAQGFTMSFDSPRQNYSTYSPMKAGDICAVKLYYEAGIARGLVLTPCERIRLGDWLTLLGQPENVSLSNTNPLLRGLAVMLVIPRTDCTKWPMSPFATVSQVSLSPANPRSGVALVSLRWHGFIPYWRYREFEPEAPSC
jgi:hypothetical protein